MPALTPRHAIVTPDLRRFIFRYSRAIMRDGALRHVDARVA